MPIKVCEESPLNSPSEDSKSQEDTLTYFCFVEYLNTLVFKKELIPYFKNRMRVSKNIVFKVLYNEFTDRGIALIEQVKQTYNLQLEHYDFKLKDVFSKKKENMRLVVMFQKSNIFRNFIVEQTHFKDALDQLKDIPYLQKYLIKDSIHFGQRNVRSLYRFLLLFHCVCCRMDEEKKLDEKVFFLRDRLWAQAIKAYAKNSSVTVKLYDKISIDQKQMVLDLFGENNVKWKYHYFKLNGVIKTLFQFVSGKSIQKLISPIKINDQPKVMLEYFGHLNHRELQKYSDVFVWQNSQLKNHQQTVLKIENAGFALDKKMSQSIIEDGILPIAINPRAVKEMSVPLYSYWPQKTQQYKEIKFNKIFKENPEDKRWVQYNVQNYFDERDYWISLFKKLNIKVFSSWFKYDARNILLTDVMKQIGGVNTIYQRAYEEFRSTETQIVADVCFIFSQNFIELEKRNKSEIDYHVITGYNGDHRFQLVEKEASLLRAQLKNSGAKHIVAFFDENSADDPRWHTGHEYMAVNYEFLLNKVLKHDWFGLVLKPKVPRTLRRRLGPVAALLEEAIATGRCHIFEAGMNQADYPPAMAAKAADLAIHGHLWAATAGLEAFLSGTPTLLVDRDGWTNSHFYQWDRHQSIVFNDWELLWNACTEHWQKHNNEHLGDWSHFIDQIDPFRDGLGAQRIGNYIQSLLDGFEQGLSKIDALERSFDIYQKAWGNNKIIKSH